MKKIKYMIAGFGLCSVMGYASGPTDVAKANQSLWPSVITDKKSYDEASRSEILVFLSVFKDWGRSTLTPESLGIKKINPDSINQWKTRFSSYWLNTFLDASKSCGADNTPTCGFKGTNFNQLLDFASSYTTSLPVNFKAWLEMSKTFYTLYLKEQVRLAALFPNPTSESLPLGENEVFGDKFKDGEFLITLDDGPTLPGGLTEKYTEFFRKSNISAMFFSLGLALEKRISKSKLEQIKTLYSQQCLASHGLDHKSHQKWTEWKDSLTKTRSRILEIFPDRPVPFRPPYGQRSQELVVFQEGELKAPVVLWNIDSQDWHSKIDAAQVGDRVQKLMMLWRKGIILFHDVHPKALTAMESLVKFADKSGIHWVNCQEIKGL